MRAQQIGYDTVSSTALRFTRFCLFPVKGWASYADFAKEKEQENNQLRAQIFEQGLPVNRHPDGCLPPVPSESDDSIEIIELPRNAIPRIPRKKWRELIQKVWEVDPFMCPNCARPMRITGLLEDRHAATALLDTLGGLGYTTDSQGARAPPSFAEPDAPELPFTCDLDGIVYESEPWKLARQQRLERHVRQRDHIAGIVVYDGEWKEEAETPSEVDPRPQAIEGSQATIIPDEFDQRPPEEWQEHQWDPTSQQ